MESKRAVPLGGFPNVPEKLVMVGPINMALSRKENQNCGGTYIVPSIM